MNELNSHVNRNFCHALEFVHHYHSQKLRVWKWKLKNKFIFQNEFYYALNVTCCMKPGNFQLLTESGTEFLILTIRWFRKARLVMWCIVNGVKKGSDSIILDHSIRFVTNHRRNLTRHFFSHWKSMYYG